VHRRGVHADYETATFTFDAVVYSPSRRRVTLGKHAGSTSTRRSKVACFSPCVTLTVLICAAMPKSSDEDAEGDGLTGKVIPGGWEVIIEDDGEVCYAYLRHNEKIVSDAWLYNVAPTPELPPWKDRSRRPPFLNPRQYVVEFPTIRRILKDDDWRLNWRQEDSTAEIYVDGALIALLREGAKPGWSIDAASDGPCAKVLQKSDRQPPSC
jgi:hypothetical protein